MITADERQDVLGVLSDWLTTHNCSALVVKAVLQDAAGFDHVPRMEAARSYAYVVLAFCEKAHGGQPLKLLLDELCVHDEQPWLVNLAARVRQAEIGPNAAAPAAAFFDDYVLARRAPFVNRRRLRQLMRRLVRPDGPAILAVNGPRKSGRSWTRNYVSHVASRMGDSCVVYVDLERDCLGAAALADRLLVKMRRATAQAPAPALREGLVATASRTVDKLGDLVLEAALGADTRWFLIFDHLDRAELLDETRSLLRYISREVATEHVADRVKVILLGYAGSLEAEAEGWVLSERLSDKVGRREVDRLCEWLFLSRKMQPDDEWLQGVKSTIGADPSETQLVLDGLGDPLKRAVQDFYDSRDSVS